MMAISKDTRDLINKVVNGAPDPIRALIKSEADKMITELEMSLEQCVLPQAFEGFCNLSQMIDGLAIAYAVEGKLKTELEPLAKLDIFALAATKSLMDDLVESLTVGCGCRSNQP